MITDQIRSARFVLAFQGEAPYVGVFNGWDALLGEIREQYTVEPDEHAELTERLKDEDSWCLGDDGLPFYYREDTGEIGSMTIYRITQDAKQKRLFVRVPNSDGQLWHCGGPDLEDAVKGLKNFLDCGGEEGESLPVELEIREMADSEVAALPDC